MVRFIKTSKNKRLEVTTYNPVIKKAYTILEINKWSKQELIEFEADKRLTLDNHARTSA